MKSLVWLTESILLDSGMRCGADPTMDIKTVHRRTEQEGESFLTITLPTLGSAFDRAIALGSLQPSSTPGFAWHRRGLPEFLRGFLLQVFSSNGRLLPEPSVEAIECVRQICYTHKKVLRECTERRTRKALDAYRKCDNEVGSAFTPADDLDYFRATARVIWSNLFQGVPFGDPYEELHPRHGPGATRERVYGNQKWDFRRWHLRLEEHFPFFEFAYANSVAGVGGSSYDGKYDPFPQTEFVEPGDEEPVRVVFVPKTQKTPRVIAIEPVCMQYMQQAICKWLVPRIESGTFTSGRVNFTRQDINASLASLSSKDGTLATLDLSEASDRVSLSHVVDMLDVVPKFRDYVLACRSTRAELPNGEIITLKKFASMGSALCFPMEAMVFFCIIVSHRLKQRSLPVSRANVFRYSRDVYVYGDDIIVPTDEAPLLAETLSLFGLKVNTNKSFWTGKFRESCGTDAYDGHNVTPTYARHLRPASKRQAEAIVSWVAMANQLYARGFWQTVRRVRNYLNKVVGYIPFGREGSPGLYWSSYSNSYQYSRWNRDLMRFERRTYVPVSKRSCDTIDGVPALMKCFTMIGLEADNDDHLQSSVARGGLALRRRWIPAA